MHFLLRSEVEQTSSAACKPEKSNPVLQSNPGKTNNDEIHIHQLHAVTFTGRQAEMIAC